MLKAKTKLENVDVKVVEETPVKVAAPGGAEDAASDYETEADLNEKEKAVYEEKFADYISKHKEIVQIFG